MIQRIQTLYLLVVTALMAVTLFCPIVSLNVEGSQVTLAAFAITDAQGVLSHASAWLGGLLAVTTLLPFVTIFLFKHRQLQIRLCGVELALLVGDVLVMVGFAYALSQNIFTDFNLGFSNLAFHIPVIMPIVSAILTFMALKATLKDELLVRSLDRIR